MNPSRSDNSRFHSFPRSAFSKRKFTLHIQTKISCNSAAMTTIPKGVPELSAQDRRDMLLPTNEQHELVEEHRAAGIPHRKLGKTGLDVTILSYGSWVSFDYQLGVEQAKELIHRAYRGGVNFFDNAEVYAHGKSELIMGQALKELDIPRCDIVVSTKVFHGCTKEPTVTARGLSRKHVIEGVKASLKRLQLEYVDIVFAHRPDPSTPIEETVRAFNWVIDQV